MKKITNPVLIDFGKANIKMHTAIRLLTEPNLQNEVSALELTDYKNDYQKLADDLVNDYVGLSAKIYGLMMVEADRWYRAHHAYGSDWDTLPQDIKDALYITYTNIGKGGMEEGYQKNTNGKRLAYEPLPAANVGGGLNHLFNAQEIAAAVGIADYGNINFTDTTSDWVQFAKEESDKGTAYREALFKLRAFVVQDGDYVEEVATREDFSDSYLQDRADMLSWLIKLKYAGVRPDYSNTYTQQDASTSYLFEDVAGKFKIRLGTGEYTFIGFGDAASNTIIGESGSDRIYGMSGNDTLIGNGGNDYLEGGKGQDTLNGGSGNDTFGIMGEDTAYDTFNGGEGIDTILGSAGDDTIRVHDFQSENTVEIINGGGGTHNILAGTDTADSIDLSGTTLSNIHGIYGEGGVDHIIGSIGNDLIYGGDEADYLDGGAGNDTLIGGAGIDTYVISGHDRIIDEGQNNILSNGKLIAGVFKFNNQIGAYQFISDSGEYQLEFNTTGGLTLSAEDSITFVNQTSAAGFTDNDFGITLLEDPGLDYDWTFTAAALNYEACPIKGGTEDGKQWYFYAYGDASTGDTKTFFEDAIPSLNINGGDGDDFLYGINRADKISGGSGNDILSGEWSYWENGTYYDIPGPSEGDQIDGGSGTDSIQGSLAADILSGGQDNDFLAALDGEDVVRGDAGNDAVTGGSHNDILSGGAGDDILFGDGYLVFSGVTVDDLPAFGVQFVFSADGYSTGYTTSRFSIATDAGVSGDDILTGGAGRDWLDGGLGADMLDGGSESDSLFGGEGDDWLFGGEGNDWLVGDSGDLSGSGNDALAGGAGSDLLYGLGGNDTLMGDAGADELYGFAGDDNLAGGFEDDYLSGGDGNDTLDGGSEIDTLFGGEGDDTLHGGAGADELQGQNGNDTLYGDDGNDFLLGDNGDNSGNGRDLLYGGAGNDQLQGAGGNDTLNGDAGDDILFGELGDDQLEGGTGNDYLDGGDGSDRYIFSKEDGADILSDSRGANEIHFSDVYDIESLFLQYASNGGQGAVVDQNGSDVLIHYSGNGTVLIEGGRTGNAFKYVLGNGVVFSQAEILTYVAKEQYGTSGQDSINGGNGDDQLYGGDGHDYVFGHNGADKLFGGTGNDHLIGGAGADILNGELGTDSADYSASPSAIIGNLLTGAMSGGDAEGDILIDMENILGSPFSDTLLGDNQVNALWGNQGNDVVYGLGGDDYFQDCIPGMNSGDDVYYGGVGNDWLNAMEGSDRLYGGPGDDTYLFSSGFGIDFVNDQEGNNLIQIVRGNYFLVSYASINADMTIVADDIDGLDLLIKSGGNDEVAIVDGRVDLNTTYILCTSAGENFEGNSEELRALIGQHSGDTNDQIEGDSTANRIYSGGGNDTVFGYGGNDLLLGENGNDTLDGGMGDDVMLGGFGDDIYTVDSSGDIVEECINEGADTIQASLTFNLGANVENLTLVGTLVINGSGNELDNIITGNSASNRLNGGLGGDTLNGGAGSDMMFGGLGDDVYIIDNMWDNVKESLNEGTDTVQSSVNYIIPLNVENLTLTGDSVNNGWGNDLDNVLTGNSADNVLDGGNGDDRMLGGLGDDTYSVDNEGDAAIENFKEGTDVVQSSVTYTLSANVENLTLVGYSPINGTGNDLDNILIGNLVTNTLYGGVGNDTLKGGDSINAAGFFDDFLIGGLGDDVYIIDDNLDNVIENYSEGLDTVHSSITYALGANVENLILTGGYAINASGNDEGNVLAGNGADNTLNGGMGNDTMIGEQGNDTLTGGAGNDFFVFATALNAMTNTDIITDFATGLDKIGLDKSIFSSLVDEGTLSSAFFNASATGLAGDANDYFLYNTSSGALLYDADGNGQGVAVQFATLTDKAPITANDFLVMA